MTSVLSSAPTAQQFLCYYSNRTSQIQVGLVSTVAGFCLEQVLFPGQRWMFWSPEEAELVLLISDKDKGEVEVNRIPCNQLRVVEQVHSAS